MASSQRQQRVAEQIQRELAEFIRLEVHDPRIGMLTLTDVDVSPDLRHAKVFFTLLGGDEARADTERGLKRAAGFLRTLLAQRLKLRTTPELHFAYDASVESGARLSRLIDEALAPIPLPASVVKKAARKRSPAKPAASAEAGGPAAKRAASAGASRPAAKRARKAAAG